jgi:hypothetical protein
VSEAVLAGWNWFYPPAADEIYLKSAGVLADALEHEKLEPERQALATDLRSLAGRLDSSETGPGRRWTARLHDDSEKHRICVKMLHSPAPDTLAAAAPILLYQLTAMEAHALARDLAPKLCSEPETDTDALSQIMTDTSRRERVEDSAQLTPHGGSIPGCQVSVHVPELFG